MVTSIGRTAERVFTERAHVVGKASAEGASFSGAELCPVSAVLATLRLREALAPVPPAEPNLLCGRPVRRGQPTLLGPQGLVHGRAFRVLGPGMVILRHVLISTDVSSVSENSQL